MIELTGNRDLALQLAARPDVARIEANPQVSNVNYQISNRPSGADAAQTALGVEWNVEKINAPAAWALGYTGQGVVVAGADTGYQWDHPALKPQYRGWNGITVTHDYNWHDAIRDSTGNPCGNDSPAPCDDDGHGTHTMGTIVGDDGAGNQVGVAPGAKWMGCRNMDEGYGTPARYIECFEFFLAPYPSAATHLRR
jgi:subtilisin family serine protease